MEVKIEFVLVTIVTDSESTVAQMLDVFDWNCRVAQKNEFFCTVVQASMIDAIINT